MIWWLATAFAGSLELEVSGMRNDSGVLVVALYASADGFPAEGERALATKVVPIQAGRARVHFSDLAEGTYAASMFHDENQNGILDMQWFGPPKEGVATTNNAKGSLGPPKFEAAAVVVSGDHTQQLTVEYLFGK